jgi:hypothetical protein
VSLSRYSYCLRPGRSGDRIPVKARFSAHMQPGPGNRPASCTIGTGYFPGVKSGRGVTLTPHPLLVPLVIKEYSYTSTPPMGRAACTEPQCLYSRAIPLLSLWAVRPVQSLSACTRVTFTFTFYTYSLACLSIGLTHFSDSFE